MTEWDNGEEEVDESGRNPSQRRMDEWGESESEEPVDVEWDEPSEGDEDE